MKKDIIPKYIIEKRKELIRQLSKEGYSDLQISIIFNMDRTWIYRIITEKTRVQK